MSFRPINHGAIRRLFLFTALFAAIVPVILPTGAAAYDVPSRGSPLRKAIMDAIRPLAEEAFGAPVEFVVDEIRVANGTAMTIVTAQRPGGRPIDPSKTPLYLQQGVQIKYLTPPRLEVLLMKVSGRWRVIHSTHRPRGPSMQRPEHCEDFADVVPKSCGL